MELGRCVVTHIICTIMQKKKFMHCGLYTNLIPSVCIYMFISNLNKLCYEPVTSSIIIYEKNNMSAFHSTQDFYFLDSHL